MTSGMVWHGEFWTRNSSEYPKDADVSFLSEVLETCVALKYYLSAKACAGTLRRIQKNGKSLPIALENALWHVILKYLGKTYETLTESDLDEFEHDGKRLYLPTLCRYGADAKAAEKAL